MYHPERRRHRNSREENEVLLGIALFSCLAFVFIALILTGMLH